MAPPNNCLVCAYPSALRCGSCKEACYCSAEHQKMAWPKHKALCKLIQTARDSGTRMPPKDTYCNLCGSQKGRLTKTECCGNTICNDQDKYVLGSFSHNSCLRNHSRYTRCSSHFIERHDRSILAEDCPRCVNNGESDPERVAYFLTNAYNFGLKVDDSKVPLFDPSHCRSCGKHIKMLVDDHTVLSGKGLRCSACADGESGFKYRMQGGL